MAILGGPFRAVSKRFMVTLMLRDEIYEQPRRLSRVLDEEWWGVVRAAERIRDFDPAWVMIAARGTSDNAARYAQYLFGVHNRLAVGLAAPSLFTLYDTPPRLERALTIGISQSGQSPDVVTVVEEARRQGGATLAITNDPRSPLATAADSCIRITAGDELAIAATKTYSNELLCLAMLSAALAQDPSRWAALQVLPHAVQAALDLSADLASEAAALSDAERMVVLGRGLNYCTAFEIALKVKETSYALAEPYSVADFLHGPVALVERGFPVVLVAPSGRGAASIAELLDLLASRHARIVAFADRNDILRRAQIPIPLPQGVPEWLSPIVAIVPGQLWALALALAKGLDPDTPRGLCKVTRTH